MGKMTSSKRHPQAPQIRCHLSAQQTHPTTGEILAQGTINPNRDYQSENKNPPPEGGG
ncbi:hypothetical protein PSCLAVI8L_280011 [Pseudoclavibacter sp. 8L]|nr:hypothetical protein PSCLAVI8L_280011 [Pseudoclavibacter sp. 8L]